MTVSDIHNINFCINKLKEMKELRSILSAKQIIIQNRECTKAFMTDADNIKDALSNIADDSIKSIENELKTRYHIEDIQNI